MLLVLHNFDTLHIAKPAEWFQHSLLLRGEKGGPYRIPAERYQPDHVGRDGNLEREVVGICDGRSESEEVLARHSALLQTVVEWKEG